MVDWASYLLAYHLQIRTRDNKVHGCNFAMVVNCAGPWASEIARKAKIGVGDTFELATPLPVEPR